MFICKLLPKLMNIHTAQPTELPSASIQMWWIEDALSIGGVCQVIMQKAYP